MRRLYVTAGLFALVGLGISLAPRLVARPPMPALPPAAEPPAQTPAPEGERARIELVFALDTTGSMGGLIEGAKDTIWSVTNDFASQRPTPEIRVGLVAYRDRGDAYVTDILPLTDDLDAVYGKLMQLQAEGGGDGPEAVGRALLDAVTAQPWTQDRPRVYRSIFLVGDAPDKGYADEPSPESTVALARSRGIYVSAIQCGNQSDTRQQLSRIAQGGGGVFSAVAQDGAVERIETPVDARLDALEREMSGTALFWGAPEEQLDNDRKIQQVISSSASSNAARRSALKKGGDKLVTSAGKGDLIDDIKQKKVALEKIRDAERPDALKGLSEEAMRSEIEAREAKRAALKAEIDKLVAERDRWLAAERAREDAEGKARYDREVVEASVKQLKALGYIE